MTKRTVTDEISILRYFEAGPIEKAEVVFNIVAEKMRERLRGRSDTEAPQRGPGRKRQTKVGAEEAAPSTSLPGA